MGAFRIVVVDDSALFRTILRNVISEIPGCEIVASAGDGATAVQAIAELRPDLVTLDLEMPEMDGIAVLRELKRRGVDTRIVMISRYTTAGAQVTTDALIEGAFDFIVKPSGKSPVDNKAALRNALEEQIQALRDTVTDVTPEPAALDPVARSSVHARFDAVVIGCSTGGPDALARIVPDLPGNLSIPVFVVQHMPEGFTASLAARLNEASELEVLEASEGMRVRGGQVILARGGRHLQISRRTPQHVLVQLSEDPHEHRCRPAVDFTLRSAVNSYDGHLLVVILTGMGRDGTEGCRLVKSRGGRILAQHADGCTVYGMPKSVITAGLAHEVIQLRGIAAAIERTVRNRSI